MTTWRQGVRSWAALAVLILPVLLISIDMTVLGFAVPALSEDLRPSGTQLLWIVDIYSFLLAGLLVLMGNLGDRIGRRRLLLLGALAFGAASVMAAFATSPAMLIAARALLGIGGATLMPSTLSLIRTVFPDPKRRRTAIAVWASAFAGGAAIGPVLGGFLLEHFWWGSVFLLNVPVMALLLVAAPLMLPESRNPAPGPFDLTSAALSILGILPLVYGLKAAGKGDLGLLTWLAILAGLVLLTLFVRRQLHRPDPLLDVRLFTHRAFSVAVLTNLLSVFAFLGLLFFLPQYLQLVLGMEPLQAGLWMVPMAIATIVGALSAPVIARRVSMATVIGIGMLLAASGFVVATWFSADAVLALVIGSGVLIGAGIGLAETLTNDTIIATAPAERAGGAASISETAYEFGAAMGIAVLGTIGLARYRSGLGQASGDLTAEMVDAAGQTLGGAHQVADGLQPESAASLLDVAHTAFTDGMTTVFWIAAVVCAWTGLQALVLLRRLPVETDDGTDEPAPQLQPAVTA